MEYLTFHAIMNNYEKLGRITHPMAVEILSSFLSLPLTAYTDYPSQFTVIITGGV
jgi:hypothetical protein